MRSSFSASPEIWTQNTEGALFRIGISFELYNESGSLVNRCIVHLQPIILFLSSFFFVSYIVQLLLSTFSVHILPSVPSDVVFKIPLHSEMWFSNDKLLVSGSLQKCIQIFKKILIQHRSQIVLFKIRSLLSRRNKKVSSWSHQGLLHKINSCVSCKPFSYI